MGEAGSGKRETVSETAVVETGQAQSLVLSSQPSDDSRWVPDNIDGSGWAEVDWVSAARGSRYHYRHAEPRDEASAMLPPFYRVVTRLETALLHAPHQNSYFVPKLQLADFLAELIMAGGAETIWHIEPCHDPPRESRLR